MVSVESIHESSARVLEKVGVDIGREPVRQRLLAAGAKEGSTNARVLLPRGFVRDCLARCSRTFDLKTALGEPLPLGAGKRHFSSCVVDPFIFSADGPRPPRLSDCLAMARLVDSIGLISMPYKMDLAYADAVGEEALLLSNLAFLSHVGKHYTCAPHGPAEAAVWRDMVEIVSGGPLGKTRAASVLVSPISPLTLDASFLDLVGFLAPAGFPLVLLPCPMAGATAPISLSGTAVVSNCENLAAIAVVQTLYPGTPLIFDNVGSAFSMRTGAASLGGPEKALLGRLGVAMARHYGLPSGIAGVSTDSSRFDAQNGAESMAQIQTTLAAGADVVYGLGSMDNGNGTSAEQILFDCELVRLADFLAKGIAADSGDAAFDSILRTGPGGDFLTDQLTLERLRSGELFEEGLFDRSGSPTAARGMHDNLKERAAALVGAHRSRIPEARREDLRRYVEKRLRKPVPASFTDP